MFRPRHIISVLSGFLVLTAGTLAGSSAFAVRRPAPTGTDTGGPAVPVSNGGSSAWWLVAMVALAIVLSALVLLATVGVQALSRRLRGAQGSASAGA